MSMKEWLALVTRYYRFRKSMGGQTIGWRLFQGSFLIESGILITA